MLHHYSLCGCGSIAVYFLYQGGFKKAVFEYNLILLIIFWSQSRNGTSKSAHFDFDLITS